MTALFIHSPNVHQGGGEKLLLPLLKTLSGKKSVFCTLDSRLEVPDDYLGNVRHKKFRPTLRDRLAAEIWLKKNVTEGDIVLCFGNLPPIFRLPGTVTVLVQNRYLLDDADLDSFSVRVKLRIRMERLWLRTRAGNADKYIVQTPSMKKQLISALGSGRDIQVTPFYETSIEYHRSGAEITDNSRSRTHDFIYIASGEPHKNHKRLVEAWSILASEGHYPSLCLTLSENNFPELWSWIDKKIKTHGLKIDNLGETPPDRIKEHLGEMGALVYPSLMESFGLPLIEAREAGLPIVASELDYIRDLVDPEETFDPTSPMSIARAIKRYMGFRENSLNIVGPEVFLESIGWTGD